MVNRYKVKVHRVIDGDTFYGDLIAEDLGLIFPDQRFRFLGVNTPERDQQGYYEAKEFTAQHTEGKTLEIGLHPKDAFGRWLIDVYLEDGTSLNELLLKEKLAKVYSR